LTYIDTPRNIEWSTPSTNNHNIPSNSENGASSNAGFIIADSDSSSGQSFSNLSQLSLSPISETEQDIKLREFNNEYLRLWLGRKGRCFSRYREARSMASDTTTRREWNGLDVSLLLHTVDEARSQVFEEKYDTAESHFKTANEGFRNILGSNHWLTLMAKFEAALMHVAIQLDCSSTVAFRFLQESFKFLNARRYEYISEDSPLDLEEVKEIMTLMHRLTVFWTSVVTTQKAIKALTILLGQAHAQVLALRRYLKLRESKWRRATYDQRITLESSRNEFAQIRKRFMDATEKDNYWKNTVTVAAHCDHVPEDEREEVLKKAQEPKPRLTEAAKQRSSHRCDSLIGAALSFGGDHGRAEPLLRNVQQDPNPEVCPENRVHQLLFYAEHKTREAAWDVSRGIMRQVYDIIRDKDNHLPDHLTQYFKPRIRNVLKAISSRLTIDDASGNRSSNFSTRQNSPAPSLASSLSDSTNFEMPEGPRTPNMRSQSPHTVVVSSESPESLNSDFWNDALRSPTPTDIKKLGKPMTQLSLVEDRTTNPSASNARIQSTTASTGALPNNTLNHTDMESTIYWANERTMPSSSGGNQIDHSSAASTHNQGQRDTTSVEMAQANLWPDISDIGGGIPELYQESFETSEPGHETQIPFWPFHEG
jgi:hypothetical protein